MLCEFEVMRVEGGGSAQSDLELKMRVTARTPFLTCELSKIEFLLL